MLILKVLILIVFVVLPLVSLSYFILGSKDKEAQALWEAVAKEAGLEISDQVGIQARIHGELRGRSIEARFEKAHSKQGLPHITIKVPVQSEINVDITQEGLGSSVEKLTGAKELVVGRKDFDDVFYIHTSHQSQLREALSDGVMSAFLQASPSWAIVEKGELNLFYSGLRKELWYGRWRKLAVDASNGLRLALKFAEALENESSSETPTEEMATYRPIDIGTVVLSLFLLSILGTLAYTFVSLIPN